jgi:hypothetical protein
MSVNVYFNNKIREFGGFKSKPYKDNSGDEMTLNGMHVFGDKGRLYLMWSEDAVIPDELKDLVEEISCYESIPQMAHRESGIYRHETAECELTPEDYGNAKREKPVYKLKITAKNLGDIQAIMHKVKTGAIRPEESYEGHQQGKHRQQLEAELTESQHYQHIYCEANKRLNAEMTELRAELKQEMQSNATLREELGLSEKSFADYRKQFTGACEKNVAVRKFVDELVSKGTWMVRGAYIVRRLSQILNGK